MEGRLCKILHTTFNAFRCVTKAAAKRAGCSGKPGKTTGTSKRRTGTLVVTGIALVVAIAFLPAFGWSPVLWGQLIVGKTLVATGLKPGGTVAALQGTGEPTGESKGSYGSGNSAVWIPAEPGKAATGGEGAGDEKGAGVDNSSSLVSIGSEEQWNPDYAPLERELRERIEAINQETGQEWGIYFEDLTSGKTFGVNEDLWVPAASTVKVPVVLYASYLVSRGELSWDERLTYVASRDWRGGAGSLQFTARDGDTFTIRELAEKAIVESDNIAWKLLERRLGKENIANFMRELGGTVVYPNGENVSTPRDMALYMKAALSFAQQSQEGKKLMYDLAHTIWNTGLNRFIADQVEVAHKEGDITGVANDVGVVYARHPYVLAIMSKGHYDVEAGFEEIGHISKVIYDYQMSLETK